MKLTAENTHSSSTLSLGRLCLWVLGFLQRRAFEHSFWKKARPIAHKPLFSSMRIHIIYRSFDDKSLLNTPFTFTNCLELGIGYWTQSYRLLDKYDFTLMSTSFSEFDTVYSARGCRVDTFLSELTNVPSALSCDAHLWYCTTEGQASQIRRLDERLVSNCNASNRFR